MQREKIVHTGKNKIWIGSMLAALIAAVAIFLLMLQMEKNMLMQYEKTAGYIAAKRIPKGTLITEDVFEEYFERRELDADIVVPGAVCSVEQVEEGMAVYDIDRGTVLMEGMFETVNHIAGKMKEPVIVGCKADDLYQMVGGVLRAGDRIHIYGVDNENRVELLWNNVYVQQVFDNAGMTIQPGDVDSSAQRLNVYIDKQDVEEFYSGLAAGTLRVVKVCQ